MAYYSKKRPGKLGTLSRPTPQTAKAIYDKMSTEERQRLMEILGSLTGLQEGPHEEFADGTHYEYDSVRKTTVEVGGSGERIPVVLVAGKLQRESQTVARKSAR